MKTISITSKGRNVEFTTRSVTVDGKTYQYTDISELRHSAEKRVYGFKCNGEVCLLPYEEQDAKVLKAIFSQVEQLHKRSATKSVADAKAMAGAAALSVEPAPETPGMEAVPEAPGAEEVPVAETVHGAEAVPVTEIAPGVEAAPEVPGTDAVPVTETAPGVEAAPVTETTPGVEAAPEAPEFETVAPQGQPELNPAEKKKAGREARKAEKLRHKEQRKAEKEEAKRRKQEEKEEARKAREAAKAAARAGADTNTEATVEPQAPAEGVTAVEETATPEVPAVAETLEVPAVAKTVDDVSDMEEDAVLEETLSYTDIDDKTGPEYKSARFKKSIIIFLIVLACLALATVVWYKVVGPASGFQMGVNSTEDTTQYNDINDMINDLEE